MVGSSGGEFAKQFENWNKGQSDGNSATICTLNFTPCKLKELKELKEFPIQCHRVLICFCSVCVGREDRWSRWIDFAEMNGWVGY